MQTLVSSFIKLVGVVEILTSFVDAKAIESTIGVEYPSFALWVIFLFPITIFVSFVVNYGWYVNSIFPISTDVVNAILPSVRDLPTLIQFKAPGPPVWLPL